MPLPHTTQLSGLSVQLALPQKLAIGVVVARGCRTEPAPAGLSTEIDAAIQAAKTRATASVDARKSKVRDMLRNGKYKPTGRGKPASEYLHQAALEDRYPRINNLVDIINLVSLQSLFPISLVDVVRAESDSFVVRHGRTGESFVFNAGGQVIDVEDLVVLAPLPADVACANPVKDSMATKLNDASTDVLAVIYAPRELEADLRSSTELLLDAFRRWASPREAAAGVL